MHRSRRWTTWHFRAERWLLSLREKPAPSPFLAYKTKTTLFLPFAGEWHVVWGGRTVGQNRHAITTDQRFAHDFIQLREGWSFRGSGDRNEDFFCFGQSLYAPAAGTVSRAADGAADNAPGRRDPSQPLGNHVILDHGNGEFSFLAHLQRGTVTVKSGDKVEAGTPVGRCGNSGNSSEPHLHFHLQNTPVPFHGFGLPAFFCDYLRGGTPIPCGEPVGGETICCTRWPAAPHANHTSV